ncbi:MAG: urate hydroxylase PuuD [Saccharospirillum sp.]|nr:urate hydroxylase PuuD [Saccharospirillum sp.]
MDVFFGEWVSLLLRWFHVIAGIAWIGASFYFIWLDNHLTEPPDWKKKEGIGGDLWAVHGGGFYEVAKYKVGPKAMPKTLHWFMWEAYSTWISGMLLMVWIYYFGAQAYLVDPSIRELSTPAAIALGLGFIASGWLIYEVLCRTPLVASRWFTPVLLVLGTAYAYALVNTFSGRAAFIHMGALIGTIMSANVLIKIIPGQRKMVAAVARGEMPDPQPGLEGKQRSVHNNYFTLPVIFLMISNHYPMTYQPSYSWLILMAIIVITVVVRHYFNLSHRGIKRPILLVCASLAFIALAGLISWPGGSSQGVESDAALLTDEEGLVLVQDKCATCHAANTTDPMFPSAAAGVRLETMDEIERWASRIAHRTAVTRDMPFMNRTEMSDEQRQALVGWLKHRF